ncbi:MAG: hypothetical protein WD690_04120 [Vicinamibacterales bacterium]
MEGADVKDKQEEESAKARAVRRRQLAQRQRDMLSRLVTKSVESGLDDLTRERLERSIRVHEDYAEFLTFARVHLRRTPRSSSLTPSDLRILDLLPERTYD